MRGLIVFLLGLLLLGGVFLAYAWLTGAPKGPEHLALTREGYDALPGWADDDPHLALEAFGRSCTHLEALPDGRPMGGVPAYGQVGDWKTACSMYALASAGLDTAEAARAFVESVFVPYRASNGGRAKGLFTGYYEAEAQGSLTPGGTYQTPLLKRPADLVQVDLGEFRDTLKGQRIAGRVVEGKLVPYPARAAIDAGALGAGGTPLVWLDDPVDAFFIHIQGSGRVHLAQGGYLRVGFDGQNGHPYTPIGRVLRKMGALEKGNVSMQTIRAWLEAHPAEGKGIMEADASYIFFKEIAVEDPTLGPLGAEEVALTPDRSLAVDRKFHALGVPMWLDTTLPSDERKARAAAFQHLMIAQDTGGAIQGPVRGDVFFGFGDNAAYLAGRMKQDGHLHVLLPKPLAARLGAGG